MATLELTKILSISTAPAPFRYENEELLQFMEYFVTDSIGLRKLKYVWKESGIRTKYSALADFKQDAKPRLFQDPVHAPTTKSRLDVFQNEAPVLGEKVARNAIQNAGLTSNDIGAIITVSCTGMYAPGLEIELSERLGLSENTERHAINFMGCYAAFHGLRLANLIAQNDPKKNILLVCVELCSLHFRNDSSDDNLLSTALFSDGAAAVVLGVNGAKPALGELVGFGSKLIGEGKPDMAWNIGNTGFEMILNRSVPKHIEKNMSTAFHSILQDYGLEPDAIQGFAIHPGGKNVLSAFASALNTDVSALNHSMEVLEQFGNMSSCSVLFVLERVLMNTPKGALIYSAAFGPGLTVESGLIKSLAASDA